MDYKIEIIVVFISYFSGQIDYDELDKKIEEIFSNAVNLELKKRGVTL